MSQDDNLFQRPQRLVKFHSCSPNNGSTLTLRLQNTNMEGTSDLGDELEGTSEPAENDLSKEKTEQR